MTPTSRSTRIILDVGMSICAGLFLFLVLLIIYSGDEAPLYTCFVFSVPYTLGALCGCLMKHAPWKFKKKGAILILTIVGLVIIFIPALVYKVIIASSSYLWDWFFFLMEFVIGFNVFLSDIIRRYFISK